MSLTALLLGPGVPGVRQEAMVEGLTALGYRVTLGRQALAVPAECLDFSLVLTWGERDRAAASVLRERRARGLPSLVYDLPLLRWLSPADGEHVGLYATRVGEATTADASDARLRQWGLAPTPIRGARSGLLVLAQVPGDAQHGLDLDAYAGWLMEAADQLRAASPNDRIYCRPHPKAPTIPLPMGVEGLDPTEPLTEQLARVAGAVTYNSAAQYVCYAEGTPCAVWARGERWPQHADAATAWARLAQASWHDWTLQEIRTPEPWQILLEGAPGPTEPVTLAAPAAAKKPKRQKAVA